MRTYPFVHITFHNANETVARAAAVPDVPNATNAAVAHNAQPHAQNIAAAVPVVGPAPAVVPVVPQAVAANQAPGPVPAPQAATAVSNANRRRRRRPVTEEEKLAIMLYVRKREMTWVTKWWLSDADRWGNFWGTHKNRKPDEWMKIYKDKRKEIETLIRRNGGHNVGVV